MEIDFARTEFGHEEIEAVKRVLQGYWLASGPENEAFEKEFANYVNADYAVCVNSGSSANLLALALLELPKGSKVLTSACGFPATLSPILHLGLQPVFVDYNIATYNIDIDACIGALKDTDIKAIIFAHTLGNPVDLRLLVGVANNLGVPVIEDCCEAVGTKINGRSVGSSSQIGTFSFYPAHQITALGGGGMLVTSYKEIALKARSLRDWGKVWYWDERLGPKYTDYTVEVDGEPYYKHYTYQTVGYNMKLPEANAAFGREQLKRLDRFVDRRIENFSYLADRLYKLGIFHELKAIEGSRPSWFGFPMTMKDSMPKGSRNSLGTYLESVGIRHRPFFAGNILRHMPFKHLLDKEYPIADKLMRDALFVGVWQGLGKLELDYIVEHVKRWMDLQ